MIYFDNAATTYPKPECVYNEVQRAIRYAGGNPGRGGHELAGRSAEEVYFSREATAKLMGCESPERVAFTGSATQALNTAISGLAPDKSEILISDIEHNSVRRAAIACKRRGCEVRVYKSSPDKQQTLADFTQKLSGKTAVAVACHRSNICGRELPIKDMAAICRKKGVAFIVDAAQSAGCTEMNFDGLGADVLCAPGHKGMLGIMGCGFMLISKTMPPERIQPLISGGSGVDSLSPAMPRIFPERLEAGTLPVPAICSLKAGAEFITGAGVREIERRERKITELAKERLMSFRGKVTVYCPDENNGSTLLFNVSGYGAEECAARLSRAGICVRAGYHCSPLAHKSIGTPEGGAVRASFGFFNTKKETDLLYNALRSMIY